MTILKSIQQIQVDIPGCSLKFMTSSFVLSLFLSASVFSAQTLIMNEQERLTVLISSQEMNRLQVVGERIASVFGPSQAFSLEHDELKGQVFLKVHEGVQKQLDISVVTESGLTQDLKLKIRGGECQTVLLTPSRISSEQKNILGSPPSEAVALIRLMVRQTPESGYGRQQVNRVLPLWRDIRVTLLEVWKGDVKEGRVYQLTNTGDVPLVLQESRFCLSPRTKALALQQHRLDPHESTRLWEVISHD